MSQRSPSNARYQKFTKPKGQTRKSAAAAKPKRGGAVTSAPSKPKPGERSRPTVPPLPPEVKIWRNIWWGMLAAAIVFSSAAWLLAKTPGPWKSITLIIAYVLIFGGLAIDFLKVRPARQAQMAGAKQSTAKKDAKKPKQSDSENDADDGDTES